MDNVELVLTDENQRVDIAVFLTGGKRTTINVPVEEEDAIHLADEIGGVWIYNTIINKFAQIGKIVFQSKGGETLYERKI